MTAAEEWWRVAIRVYLDTPELIYASFVLGAVVVCAMYAVGRISWKLRDQSAIDNEKAMTTRLALAHDQSGILEKKVAELTQRVESQNMLAGAVRSAVNADEQQLFISSLLNHTATLSDSVKSISKTSHDLGTLTAPSGWVSVPFDEPEPPSGGLLANLSNKKKP
jgi:hypothetical protein